MTSFVRERGDAGGCFVAEYGTCGELRYLDEMPGGLLGTTRYFDASGKLVATFHYNIDHPGSSWDGPKQTCVRTKTDDLCQPKR